MGTSWFIRLHPARGLPSYVPHKLRKNTRSSQSSLPTSQHVRRIAERACDFRTLELCIAVRWPNRSAIEPRSRCSSPSGRTHPRRKPDRPVDRKPAFRSGSVDRRRPHPRRRRPCRRFHLYLGSSLLGWLACRDISRSAHMCSSSCLPVCRVGRVPDHRDRSRCKCRRSPFRNRGTRTLHRDRGTCSIQSSHSRSA